MVGHNKYDLPQLHVKKHITLQKGIFVTSKHECAMDAVK